MKLLALLIALTASVHAQTLKWTFPLPDRPPTANDQLDDRIRTDAAGNTAFASGFIVDGVLKFSVLWLSASAKQLMTDEISPADNLNILFVSGSELLLFCEMNDGSSFLRKYVRKNRVVTSKDTELPKGTKFPGRTSSTDHGKNFYIMVERDENSRPIALRRYNLK